MKKWLSLLLSFLMIVSIISSVTITATAASVSDLTFELNYAGTGYDVSFCKRNASGTLSIPATYKGLPVISIEYYAFEGCSKLTEVTIPDSVTKIDFYAFADCTSLSSITIPDSVVDIGDSAFYNCTSLVSITIPDSVKYIGEKAFVNTGYYNQSGNWYNNVLYINNRVIDAKETLKGSVDIKNGTKVIESNAFENCTGLISINIPDSVTSIGDFAFYGCTSLKNITVPDSVTSIEDYAFYRCTSLKNITVPDSVTNTGVAVFNETAYYNDSSNWENGSLYIGKHLIDVKSVTGEYNVKEGTKTIAGGAVDYCSGLTSVSIPCSVVYIGHEAFAECRNLKSILIPASVKEIGIMALGYYFEVDKDEGYLIEYKLKDFTIFGAKGSAAEIYAKEYGFTFKECSHSFSGWVVTQNATLHNAGSKQSECSICGYIKTTKIPQLKCATPKLKTIANTATGVKITWGKVTGADSYDVYRKTGSGSWKRIGKNVKTTSYTDKSAKSGKNYKYTVRARNEAGFSDYNTKGLSIKCLADPTLKTPTSARNGIGLKWTKVTGAQGYIIYRKTGSGSYTKLKTEKGISNLSYVDKSAKKGKTYTYKVKAYYGKTYSAYSNAKTIKDKY